MIDFSKNNHVTNCYRYREEVIANAEQHCEKIRGDLQEVKNDKFWLGVHLTDLYVSKSYCYISPLIADNCHPKYFFQFCEEKFDMEKTQVQRLMNVTSEFGDAARGWKEEYKDFSYAALVEMLPLTPSQRQPITPEWSRQRIRDYKRALANSEPELHSPLPEPDEPEEEPAEEPEGKYNAKPISPASEKLSRIQLLNRLGRLEVENQFLRNALEENGIPIPEFCGDVDPMLLDYLAQTY